MKNWKYRTIILSIQEFVRMPCCCQRSCLCLAIAYDYSGNQIWIVKHCTERMSDRITKLTSLIDGTGSLRCNVAGNTAWEGELLIQSLKSFHILADVRIYLTISSLQIGVCHEEVAAMSWS